MKLKIGDKVKVVSELTYFSEVQGMVGEIITCSQDGYVIFFEDLKNDMFAYPHEVSLIEQQLQFDFMTE